MKQQLVFIEWNDASMWGTDVHSREEAEEMGLTHGYACGFLIHEDKEKVVLAIDWFDENDDFRHVNTYPKTGIKKITKLALPK